MEEKTYLQVRVGISDDLENILLKYSNKFSRYPEGDSTVKKFFIIDEDQKSTTYTMISDTEGGVISPTDYYNITVTVWGDDPERVKEKMSDLEKNLGIELRNAPGTLLLKYKVLFGLKIETAA